MALKVEMRLDKLELQEQNEAMVELLNEASVVMDGQSQAILRQQAYIFQIKQTMNCQSL